MVITGINETKEDETVLFIHWCPFGCIGREGSGLNKQADTWGVKRISTFEAPTLGQELTAPPSHVVDGMPCVTPRSYAIRTTHFVNSSHPD